MVRLLFFGKLGDLAGGRAHNWALPADVRKISGLINAIATEDKTLGDALKARSVRVVVNEKVAERDAAIADGDEIAFLPPASGG